MVIAIVIGLQTVGVILMSAMIIAPAIAAKQWHNRLAPMMMSAMIIAIASCILGVLISEHNQSPTHRTNNCHYYQYHCICIITTFTKRHHFKTNQST